MQLSTHFALEELVHPKIFEIVGERSADFLHPNLIVTLEQMKTHFGKNQSIVVNDYLWGGAYLNSGLRLPDSKVGATLSAHRFGCAVDCKFKGQDIDDVQENILQHPHKFPFITRMESAAFTKTWLHVEVGAYRNKDILVFNP